MQCPDIQWQQNLDMFIETKIPQMSTLSQESIGEYTVHQNQQGNQEDGIQYRRKQG